MFSTHICNSGNFQRSIWSSVTAIFEFGMVLPHFVREPFKYSGKFGTTRLRYKNTQICSFNADRQAVLLVPESLSRRHGYLYTLSLGDSLLVVEYNNMQTSLGCFGIGKLGPHNQPISHPLPTLTLDQPVENRKPGRSRKEIDPTTAADLQQRQQDKQQQKQQQKEQQQG